MKPNHKSIKEKEIIRLFREYDKIRDAAWNDGTYVEVEPYQRGWTRTYVLRDDIKNRNDARDIRQVLDLINSVVFSHREDFLTKNWKTGKWEDINQPLKYIDHGTYNKLSEKHKSYFSLTYSRDRNNHNKLIECYVFKYPFFFVLKKSENIVTHHWIPNPEIQQRYGELKEKINRDNLWPKYNKARSRAHHNGYRFDSWDNPSYKNRMEQEFTESMFEHDNKDDE